MSHFVFYDRRSERLYNARTNSGRDHEMVNAFREMTRPFDRRRNAVPDSCTIFMTGIMATEVYYVSDSTKLKCNLARLIAAIPDVDKPTRRDYERRLEEFIDRAQSNLGMHSVSLLSEEPLVVKSRLFKRVSISLEFDGGYLVRLFFNFEPSSYLHNSIYEISSTQYNTKLKLWYKHPLLQRQIVAKPYFGSDGKRIDVAKLDQSIQADVCQIIRNQVMPGIYLGQFNGIPLLQRYEVRETTHDPSELSDSPSSSEKTSFFDLLLSPSNKYSQTCYYSGQGERLVEYRPRSGRSLTAFAKIIAGNPLAIDCHAVLRIIAEKEALWLQSSMIYDIERQYASSLLAKNTKSLKAERQEMYKQEVIYDTIMAAFKFRNMLHGTDPDGPVTGLMLPIGWNDEIDFGRYGYGQIRQASRLINQHLRPLLRRSVIVKEEAETAFQRWIQRASIVFAILVFPIAQVFWERVADCLFPAADAPIARPSQRR